MGGSTEVSLPPTTAKNPINPVRQSLCITNRDISMRLQRRLNNKTLKATNQGGEYRKNLSTITTSANDWALQGAYLIGTIQQNSSSWRAVSHPPGHEKWGWKSESSNLTYLDEGFPRHCSCHPQIGLFWTDCEWKVISSKFSTRQHCHEQHAPNQGPNSKNHQIPRPDTTYSVQSSVEGSFYFWRGTQANSGNVSSCKSNLFI